MYSLMYFLHLAWCIVSCCIVNFRKLRRPKVHSKVTFKKYGRQFIPKVAVLSVGTNDQSDCLITFDSLANDIAQLCFSLVALKFLKELPKQVKELSFVL